MQSNKYLRWWPVYLGVILLILGLFYLYAPKTETQPEVEKIQSGSLSSKLGKFDYVFEVITETEDHQKGLSNRMSLPDRHGLLFVFPAAGNYGIWMKDMNFAIDIIWLDEDKQVIGLAENIQPESYPETFHIDQDSLFVIEINAGEAARAGLKLGDRLQLPNVN